MNQGHRHARESLIGARCFPAAVHRRGQSLTLAGGAPTRSSVTDENHLDLFSRNRRSLSVTSSDESSDVSVKLGRLSVGSAKVSRNGIDDLLSSSDGGKHDYDWLLTPPGTPTMFPSTEGSEPQRIVAAPRGTSLARSASTTKASRLSVSHSETNQSSRPARSSSVTRSSTSTSMYNAYSSNKASSILNTSSASVSSYTTRPSSPITRSSSVARPTTPSSRPTLSRASTPSRARPAPPTPSLPSDRTRPGQNSRPSTPTSRPQIPANLSSPATRSTSRPSTPTRRSPAPSISPASSPSISAARVLSNGRSQAQASRPSSPSARVRPQPQPIVPPDFPIDTPPNLRTTLSERAVSAGRSRPGASVTPKAHSEPPALTNPSRRHSSPIVARGRATTPEPTGKGRVHGNGHVSDHETRRGSSHVPESAAKKPLKISTATSVDGTGFGRTISKKSLDMAIRHMDIRNGGNIRPLSGATLFPQSIRTVAPKPQSARSSNASSISINGGLQTSYNGLILENGSNGIHRVAENGMEHGGRYSAKLSELDIYESSRYDTMLLKEDLKNTNWLHSIDDKSDQGSIFDHGFESLPEPFGLL